MDIGGGNDPNPTLTNQSTMRKIESQMNAAIANGTNWAKANTSVSFEGEVAEVRLHGNLIARVGEGFIELFDGGWQTTTTKSRLNAILSENGIPGERVFAKAFNWFVSQEGGPVPFFSGMRLN